MTSSDHPTLSILPRILFASTLLATLAHAQSWEADAVVTWLSPDPGDGTGFVVENAGDVDGDGRNDVLISAPYKPSPGGAPSAGWTWIVSSDGTTLHTLVGVANDNFGHSVASAGDVDGDGLADTIVGAPSQTGGGPGRAYLYSAGGTLLQTFVGESAGDQFGFVVAGAGDVDADGFGDFIVGAPQHDSPFNNCGKAYVYSGQTGSLLYSWSGLAGGDRMGASVGSAGDRNSDGHDDLLVSATKAGLINRGQAYVYSGIDGSLMCTLDSPNGGVDYGNYFSGLAGDVDADGLPDVYVIDYSRNAGRGRLYIYSGADCTELHRITGPIGSQFLFGRVRAGDVDGDGHDDLVMASGQYDGAANNGGGLYLYSGADGKPMGTFSGEIQGLRMGTDSAGLGDVTGDGVPDVMVGVGAVNGNTGGFYIFSGAPNPPRSFCTATPNSTGSTASIGYQGSLSLAEQAFEVLCNGLPAASLGLFFGGDQSASLPFGDGLRCVGGALQRYGVQVADANGTAQRNLIVPTPASGPLPTTMTWHLQYWYRDPGSADAGFNTSDGLRLSFRP